MILQSLANEHHPLSACLGFIPEDFQLLLYPLPSNLRLPPQDNNKNTRRRTKELLNLQLHILSSAHKIFTKWQKLTYPHYKNNPHLYHQSLLDFPPGHLYRTYTQWLNQYYLHRHSKLNSTAYPNCNPKHFLKLLLHPKESLYTLCVYMPSQMDLPVSVHSVWNSGQMPLR